MQIIGKNYTISNSYESRKMKENLNITTWKQVYFGSNLWCQIQEGALKPGHSPKMAPFNRNLLICCSNKNCTLRLEWWLFGVMSESDGSFQ